MEQENNVNCWQISADFNRSNILSVSSSLQVGLTESFSDNATVRKFPKREIDGIHDRHKGLFHRPEPW